MELSKRQSPFLVLLLISSLLAQHFYAVNCIGANYGTLGNNLAPPAKAARFLKDKTFIDCVKIFDANPEIIHAIANTGILLTLTVPNGDIPSLTNLNNAWRWVDANIKLFYPATKIHYILMSNEILHWGPQN